MEINPNETLIGYINKEILDPTEVTKITLRIEWLRKNYLKKKFETLVDVLYQDPKDGRLWELTYPNGYMNRGGLPQLSVISTEEADEKYTVEEIHSSETEIDSNVGSLELSHQILDRIFRIAFNYFERVFYTSVFEGLYNDPKDNRLWELIAYSNERGTGKINFKLSYISNENARNKYRVEKIRKEDLVIDCNFDSKEDRMRAENRIFQLTHNYLKKIFDAGWEVLYRDPKDNRLWELTYPDSEMHGGGLPKLCCLSQEEVVNKYNITL